MRVVVRTVSWVVLFASLGAAGASWFTPTPELDADDAVELARTALAKAGVASELADAPRAAVHESDESGSVDAWFVELAVPADGVSERIELRVQRSAGRLVYVDDRIGPDDTERLLDDAQFEALGGYRDDTLADRWVLRNALAAVSAILIAGTSFVLATRSDALWSTR